MIDYRDADQHQNAHLASVDSLIALSRRVTALEAKAPYTPPIAAVTSPARALDTDFQIHSERAALVFYTIELTAPALLTGTASAQVQLTLAGSAVAIVKNLLTVSLGVLSLTMTSTQQKVLVGHIPAGTTVNLTSSVTNGGTATLINSVEVLL